jgi:hypothetical protein
VWLLLCGACSGLLDLDGYVFDATQAVGPGAGGSGGEAQCVAADDCPGSDSACRSRRCVDGACGTADDPVGTPCMEDGGAVCDGHGSCVACSGPEHCPISYACRGGACVPSGCVNDALDAGETDVDCGGDACPPCANGDDCIDAGDCASGFCAPSGSAGGAGGAGGTGGGSNGAVCAPCVAAADCAPGELCTGGVCTLSPNGAPCNVGTTCESGFCADAVCCNDACSGTCRACVHAKTEATDGTCVPIPTGQDPDDECAGSNVCDGNGACGLPLGAACQSAPDCASGFCPADDAVCCNTPCTDECVSCIGSEQSGGSDGTCGFVTALSDPQNECPGSHECDGAGTCN